jgi:hypothetical protein
VATTGEVLTMDLNEEFRERTAELLLYMMAAMVAVSKSVKPRVVMEDAGGDSNEDVTWLG